MTAIPAEFDPWVDAATDHLTDSLETAIDELQRDRDFMGDDRTPHSPPPGPARDEAIAHAMRRFMTRLANAQEG